MKKTPIKSKTQRRWPNVFTAAAAALFAVILVGCSHTTDPPVDDNLGTVNMRITLALPQGAETVSAEAAQPVVDSLAVLVFRGGNGAILEVRKGVAVDGSTTDIDVRVRCVAEANKKVGVELFDHGTMVYFGVDEAVTVQAYQNTDVTIDALDIRIDHVAVSPVVAGTGETVTLSWEGVPAAGIYGVQESRTEFFEDVIWETLTTDTLLLLTRPLGTHYFRVAPFNQYTAGSFSDAALCYVTSGTEPQPSITAVTPPAAPPGGLVTISGVNLDLPGSRVFVGSTECSIVSAQDDEMVIQLPLTGQTDHLVLATILGTSYSLNPFVVQRIAFVAATGTGGLVSGYLSLITYDPSIISWSGVEVITVTELDVRDMSVFDLIVIAGDTGDLGGDWGNDPSRAQVIANSGAQILAIGTGGAEYLQLTHSDFASRSVMTRLQQDLHVPDVGLFIFSSPYQVPFNGPSTLVLCDAPEEVVAFHVPGAVSSTVWLYATYIDDQTYYPLMDSMVGSGQNAVISFFWGYNGDPVGMNAASNGFFLNVINMLMNVQPVVPPAE